jgi:hypothetical protein
MLVTDICEAGSVVSSFAGRPADQPHSMPDWRHETHRTVRLGYLLAISAFNPLTKGKQSVSNFSEQCNERPHKQRSEYESQRQNKPMFSITVGVFRAPEGVLDLPARDTPRSQRENENKNVGVRASRKPVNKGGVAYGDKFKIVSLDFLLWKFSVTGLTP